MTVTGGSWINSSRHSWIPVRSRRSRPCQSRCSRSRLTPCQVTAEEIYRRVWGEEAWSSENTVMVHIRRIREKIELNPREPDYLKVVWGIGYKMEKK